MLKIRRLNIKPNIILAHYMKMKNNIIHYHTNGMNLYQEEDYQWALDIDPRKAKGILHALRRYSGEDYFSRYTCPQCIYYTSISTNSPLCFQCNYSGARGNLRTCNDEYSWFNEIMFKIIWYVDAYDQVMQEMRLVLFNLRTQK